MRDRPQRPDRSRRHPRSKNPNERVDGGAHFGDASATAPTRAAWDESSPPRQRHRLPAEPRSRRSRPRVAMSPRVALPVALVGGAVFAGIQLIGTRHSAPSPTAAKPTGLPTHAMTPTATPPPLACGVPASVLTTMPVRDKLAQRLRGGAPDAAAARRAVTPAHVGGIFIASWTDLAM